MKNAIRYGTLIVAAVAVAAVLALWKKRDREEAVETLRAQYGALINFGEHGIDVGCSSERLVDLRSFAALLRRAGRVTILDLTGAPELVSLAGVERLPDLESLIAFDCPKLESLDGLAGHRSLRELTFTDCVALADASGIRELPKLETLDLSGCASLSSVEASGLPALRSLFLSRCDKIESLELSGFPSLRMLYLDGCAGLRTLEGVEALAELSDLDLSHAEAFEGVASLGGLPALEVIDLRWVEVPDFGVFARLGSLRTIRLAGQGGLADLEPFRTLSELRELHLEAMPDLVALRGMPAGVSRYAGFTHCPELASLEGIEAAVGLEHLDLTACEKLSDLAPLGALDKLRQVSLAGCVSVTSIEPIAGHPDLRIVVLGGSGVSPAVLEGLARERPDLILDFSVGDAPPE